MATTTNDFRNPNSLLIAPDPVHGVKVVAIVNTVVDFVYETKKKVVARGLPAARCILELHGVDAYGTDQAISYALAGGETVIAR